MPETPVELLSDWVQRDASPDAVQWLFEKSEAILDGDTRTLYLSFGLAARKFGKQDLNLSAADLEKANEARTGWNPQFWTTDQAARTLLIMALPGADPTKYVADLDRLFNAAELGELVALYQALPLLPYPESLVNRAAEGLRTNIKPVFCAVAHRNPFAEEQFDENTWNQMVLKALFIFAPLDPIIGIDRKANPALGRMLIDYAHERLAAKRPIPVELWRVVAPFVDEIALADMEVIFREGEPLEQQAVGLALSQSATDEGDEILSTNPEIANQIQSGQINWQQISEAAHAS